MRESLIPLALIPLLFSTGCSDRKSDVYLTLQAEEATLAPLAKELKAEKAELEAQLRAIKSGVGTSDVPTALPDRIKLTLKSHNQKLQDIEPQRSDDAATDALLGWLKQDYEARAITPKSIQLQAKDNCEDSAVLRELSAAKLYYLGQRRFWRPLQGLVLFTSMPIRDNPIYDLIHAHGSHVAEALEQAREQITKTPKWESHFQNLYERTRANPISLQDFLDAGFPAFSDQCLLIPTSYQEPFRDLELEDGSLHPELATEQLTMTYDVPAGAWLYSFWLRRFGDGTMPVISKVLDGYLAHRGGDR